MLNLISNLFYIIDSILILNFNVFIFMHAIIAAYIRCPKEDKTEACTYDQVNIFTKAEEEIEMEANVAYIAMENELNHEQDCEESISITDATVLSHQIPPRIRADEDYAVPTMPVCIAIGFNGLACIVVKHSQHLH